jgi:hypothetical protein
MAEFVAAGRHEHRTEIIRSIRIAAKSWNGEAFEDCFERGIRKAAGDINTELRH